MGRDSAAGIQNPAITLAKGNNFPKGETNLESVRSKYERQGFDALQATKSKETITTGKG
jgi:hypothetical protein